MKNNNLSRVNEELSECYSIQDIGIFDNGGNGINTTGSGNKKENDIFGTNTQVPVSAQRAIHICSQSITHYLIKNVLLSILKPVHNEIVNSAPFYTAMDTVRSNPRSTLCIVL